MTMAAPPAPQSDPFYHAREFFEAMVGWAQSTGPTDHSEMECASEERERELLRRLYQAWYDTLAAVEKREAKGVPMPEGTRVCARGRQLESMLGRVHPVRLEYRRAGEKGRLPLDARLNQQTAIRDHARSRRRSITLVLDLIHVIHYVWLAGFALSRRKESVAAEWVVTHLRLLRARRS